MPYSQFLRGVTHTMRGYFMEERFSFLKLFYNKKKFSVKQQQKIVWSYNHFFFVAKELMFTELLKHNVPVGIQSLIYSRLSPGGKNTGLRHAKLKRR